MNIENSVSRVILNERSEVNAEGIPSGESTTTLHWDCTIVQCHGSFAPLRTTAKRIC